MVRLLTTLSALPTRRLATSWARCDFDAFATEPDSMTPSPTPSMRTSEFGRSFCSIARTPLMSRGRSITTDLPMPSCTKREPESEPTTWIGAPEEGPVPTGSLACARPAKHASATPVSATRAEFHVVISLIPQQNSLRRGHGADAEAHRVDAGLLAGALVIVRKRGIAGIREAAQRKRERAELARQRERFALARGQFKRRGLPDHDLLPVLLAQRLVDREDPDVGQDGVG